jgi:uridine phosphorylase
LRVRPQDVAPYALVCGDPQRARQIAARLEHSERIGEFREYLTFSGQYQGHRLTVSSHGVGAAGAVICFEELIRAGARTIIRVGTCGSYRPRLRSGGVVIGTAAVREDGVTPEMVPLAFPAVANLEVTQALLEAARARPEIALEAGIVRTHAAFYGGLLPSTQSLWVQAGVVAVEMEFAALLVTASLRGARAGGVFAVDGNPTEEADMTRYNPHREVVEQAKVQCIELALEAAATLASAD